MSEAGIPGALWALGMIAALAYLPQANRPPSAMRSALKTLPLLCLAAASHASQAPPLLSAALFFSALGDFALSRPGRTAFLYGLAAFALAHLAYILLFLELSGARLWEAFALQPLPALALLALAFSTETWLQPYAGALKWALRAYVVLITGMGLAALTIGAGPSGGTNALQLAGAGLFILSDLILALRLFRQGDSARHAGAATLAVWLSYIAAQSLILIGLAA